MWGLPGPGLEPVSPALAGGFLATVPPGKSRIRVFDGEGQVQEQGSERGESRTMLKKVSTRGKILRLIFSSVILSKLTCFYFHG